MPLLPIAALLLTAADPAPAVLDWRPVVRANQDLHVSGGNDGILVHGDGGRFRLRGDHADSVCLDDREVLPGTSPDLLATDFVPMSSCPGSPALWRRQGKGWRHLRPLEAHDILSSPWTEGRTLLALVPWGEGPPWGYDLAVAGGGVAPRPARAGWTVRSGDSLRCRTRLQEPLALWAFPEGEVHVLGSGECPDALSTSLVHEHWAAGSSASRIDRIPLADLRASAAPSSDNIWLLGPLSDDSALHLAQFDGREWLLVRPPVPGTIRNLAWQGAGDAPEALWILTDSVLWRWSEPRLPHGGGELASFRLPVGCDAPGSLAVRGDHPWIACGGTVSTTDPDVAERPWPFSAGNDCARRWIGRPAPGKGCLESVHDRFELPPSPSRSGPGRPLPKPTRPPESHP